MFNTLIQTYKISFVENTNQFLYGLKKMPLIGKKLPNSIYKSTKLKEVLSIIGLIFGVIKKLFNKFVYIFFMIALPAALMEAFLGIEYNSAAFNILFFLNFIFGPINNSVYDKYDESVVFMMKLMRLDAKSYYTSQNIMKYIEFLLFFTLPISFTGCSIEEALVFVIEIICIRAFCTMLTLCFYKKKKKILFESSWTSKVVLLVVPICAYLLPILKHPVQIQSFLLNIFTIIIFVIIGIVSIIYEQRFEDYNTFAKKLVRYDAISNMKDDTEISEFNDVKAEYNEEDIKCEKKYDKEGFDLLNDLFYKRHKKLFISPIKIRVICILIVTAIISMGLLILPSFRTTVAESIPKLTGAIVFVMYIISIGERITKAFFFHCDNSLLRFGFYKEPKVILDNFKSRLKITVTLNMIPALALSLGIIVVSLIVGINFISIVPLILTSITLSSFFAIHYLFMYYVVQPYTAQLKIENGIYRVSKAIIYFISYNCLSIKTTSLTFPLIVIGTTVIYSVFALIMTYKLGPKNFKLR